MLGCAALWIFVSACTRPTEPVVVEKNVPAPTADMQLEGRIWRVEQPSSGFLGTIYIFEKDGTLLQTSCKETYRIAKWSSEPGSGIRVIEDGQLAFEGKILDTGPTSARMERRLRTGETDELKLTAVTEEFVCPDLR